MIGELLYHLHRHIRLVLLVCGVGALTTAGVVAYATAKHFAIL